MYQQKLYKNSLETPDDERYYRSKRLGQWRGKKLSSDSPTTPAGIDACIYYQKL
jgi:hypothetical protein